MIGITGGKGFIGSHLAKSIEYSLLFDGDLKDRELVRNFVRQCDVIYHIAGKNTGHGILENNLIATANLVLATKLENVKPLIIFASTIKVETDPNSEYGLVKRAEEVMIKGADKWCIYRIPNVYGEDCKPYYNSVVATFCDQIVNRKQVRIENTTKRFIYIDDLIIDLLNYELHKIIRPIGEEMTIRQVYEYLTIKLGQHEKLKRCFDRAMEVNNVPRI